MKCTPLVIVIYMLGLLLLMLLFIPTVVPIMILMTYLRDGTLEVPPLKVDDFNE